MADTWLQSPYTDAGWLSYVHPGVQQHPGNGYCDTIAERTSVARTRRGYCTPTPSSCVKSLTCGFRTAYDGQPCSVGPYQFTTDAQAPVCP